MADPRFYTVAGPFNLEHLADIAVVEKCVSVGMSQKFTDVAALSEATREHVSFIDNRHYLLDFTNTDAGVVVVPPDLLDRAPKGASLLVSKRPYNAYAKIAWAFYPSLLMPPDRKTSHSIASTAKLGNNIYLDVGVVIKDGAEIGENTIIGANTVIEQGVKVGENSWIGSNVTLAYCLIGDRAIIHAGSRIGQDGYGFAPAKPLSEKVPQLGRVIIENDVEIGSNTCIDRGASVDTKIGEGSKLDNLVQVAHNVKIGKGCLLAAQVGVAGSTRIGDHVLIGGQAGISGHLTVGNDAKIAGQAGVSKNVGAGETVAGFPAMNARRFWENMATLKKITEQTKNKR